MTIFDTLPGEINFAMNTLALHWLPGDWYRGESQINKCTWANVFGRGGFVRVDMCLSLRLGEHAASKDGLGTFAKFDGYLYFVWVDDNGAHAFKFPPFRPWESRFLRAIFTRCLGMVPDFTKDYWASLNDELQGTIETLSKVAVSGEALGLFGGAVTLR